ncbi:MAG: SMP-30/gluconolactonase/LRE family protein [Bryobacteraceae bacterium]
MDAELKSITGDSPKVTRIATGFHKAAGPVYSRIGYLLFCDADNVLRWQDGSLTVFRPESNQPRALTFDHQGRLLACEKDRLTRTEKNGGITVLAKGSGLADVIYAIDQNIYFCDAKAVYRVKRGGGTASATHECRQPGGVALAPNQQRLYVSDSASKTIRVFDIADNGALANGRVFAGVKQSPLRGLKTDEGGRVWLAGPSGILVFNRQGEQIGEIPIPEPPSNLNWAAGFRDIIATAGNSVYRIEARTNGTRTF